MQDCLQVTKVLADNCRTKGTAFRLGVCFHILLSFKPNCADLPFMFTFGAAL
jgi:hypothetical protein